MNYVEKAYILRETIFLVDDSDEADDLYSRIFSLDEMSIPDARISKCLLYDFHQ